MIDPDTALIGVNLGSMVASWFERGSQGSRSWPSVVPEEKHNNCAYNSRQDDCLVPSRSVQEEKLLVLWQFACKNGGVCRPFGNAESAGHVTIYIWLMVVETASFETSGRQAGSVGPCFGH